MTESAYPPKHVLAATDFSPLARRSVRYAAQVCRSSGAALHLVHVVGPLPSEQPPGAKLAEDRRRELQEIRDEQARASLQGELVEAGLAGADVTVAEGDPADAIVRVATERGCDMIVMATHGRGGLRRALLGSVTELVIRRAPCPVLVVR